MGHSEPWVNLQDTEDEYEREFPLEPTCKVYLG